MNSKNIGDKTEYLIISKLILMDFNVLKPIGDNQRYDIGLDYNGKLIRIQCKTARYDNGCIVFNTKSVYKNNEKNVIKNYTKEEIDFFIAYSYHTNSFYIINISESAKGMVRLRIENAKNYGKQKTIRWAKDYLLDNWKLES